MTLAGALVDELTTLPREFWRQLLARASVPGAMIFATTNPDAPRHWLRTEYLLRLGELPDWQVWHFTMEDNPGLTPEYIESLKREYTGVWYARFIEGKWVAAEGAIYDVFDADVHVIKHDEMPPMDQVLAVAVDYGTVHRTRGYLLGIGRDSSGTSCLYVLDEFAPGTATVGQHAQMFRTWLEGQPIPAWRTPQWIAVDPAAAVFRQQLFDDGITNVMRAHNSVLNGIQIVSSLFAAGRLRVSDRCTHLIDGIPGYRWDSAASEKGRTEPIKQDDDEVDALRYVVYSTRRLWRSAIPLASTLLDDADDSSDD